MPAVEIERRTSADPAAAWAFVSDMDHWAPLLTGYQRHEQIDDRHSVWVVKGELAGLTRLAEFDVTITEWVERDHIAFTLQGRDEPFSGSGAFHIEDGATQTAPLAPSAWWRRLRARVARWLLGRVTTLAAETAQVAASPVGCRLRCRLEVQAGGGSGPIMNLLLGPIIEAVATDTAIKIAAALEGVVSPSPR